MTRALIGISNKWYAIRTYTPKLFHTTDARVLIGNVAIQLPTRFHGLHAKGNSLDGPIRQSCCHI
jgi:hypothetical protein